LCTATKPRTHARSDSPPCLCLPIDRVGSHGIRVTRDRTIWSVSVAASGRRGRIRHVSCPKALGVPVPHRQTYLHGNGKQPRRLSVVLVEQRLCDPESDARGRCIDSSDTPCRLLVVFPSRKSREIIRGNARSHRDLCLCDSNDESSCTKARSRPRF